jgi:hypothetical protein
MPQATNVVASFENGLVRAEVDFNSQTGVILRGRVINGGDQPAYMYVKLDPPIQGYSVVGVDAPAGQTTEVNWPNNVVRYTEEEYDDDGDGEPDGVRWALKGISIFCRYPGHS